ncbi:MAG: phosphoenolpyruvate synthase, partial [Halothiobacillus sp.]|nr:phosphoenolpyruvate synthase [Halothiobacillus sp.]
MSEFKYIRFFNELGIDDVPLVGGKNASLGEMYRKLSPAGVRIPNGFAITAEAYRYMLDSANAWPALHDALDALNPEDVDDLARRGKRAREIVYGAGLPDDLAKEIIAAYRKLQEEYGEDVGLAVRSSATAEDLPTASFAGQQDTFLNVRGEQSLLDACRRDFASLFTDRAIHYRVDQGFDHFKIGLSIGVMKMVRSDLSASGVMFSLDTESGFRDVVFITGSYGLGENIVQGAVDPDEFYVHKPTFAAGHRAVLRRNMGGKAIKMIYMAGDARNTTRNVPTPADDRGRFCIGDADVLELAEYAIAIESHYGHPMDMEWAKDGLDGKIYIVQARPETVASQRRVNLLESYALDGQGAVIITGRSVGERIATGTAHVIRDVEHLGEFKPGEVLIADTTTPDWEPVMKTAAAIVTNRGGRTCHAAIIARELGIPAVVGAGDATTKIPNGATVTVSCAEGDTGRIYKGAVPFHVDTTEVGDIPRPATQIMINLGNPDLAFKTS